MGTSTGALGHSLCGTSLQPTLLLAKLSENPKHNSRLKLLVVEDSLRIPLDEDLKVVVQQRLGGSGRQSRTMLERLLLAPQPEGLTGLRLGRGARAGGGRVLDSF